MHRDTNVCCAAIPGSKGDDVSKILNALDDYANAAPVGAFLKHRVPYTKRAMKQHVKKVAFPGLSWVAWIVLRILVSQVISWWIRRNVSQPEVSSS